MRIPDGITIVTCNHIDNTIIKHNGIEISKPKADGILPLTKTGTMLISSIEQYPHRIQERKHKDKLYGLRTFYVERNPEHVSKTRKDNYIKGYLANDKKGIAKRVEEYWIDKDVVIWDKINSEIYSHYKVVASAAGIVKNPSKINYKLLPPHTIVGESWVVVGHFTTIEEALNYKKYLDTNIIRILLRESQGGKSKTWGCFVPDLEDYTNNNTNIDWNNPLEPQLYRMFNVKEDHIREISTHV